MIKISKTIMLSLLMFSSAINSADMAIDLKNTQMNEYSSSSVQEIFSKSSWHVWKHRMYLCFTFKNRDIKCVITPEGISVLDFRKKKEL